MGCTHSSPDPVSISSALEKYIYTYVRYGLLDHEPNTIILHRTYAEPQETNIKPSLRCSKGPCVKLARSGLAPLESGQAAAPR